MQIIETLDDFTALVESSSFVPYVMVPILCDVNAHPVVNPLSVLYVSTLQGERYLFLFDHNDGQRLPVECKERLTRRMEEGSHRIVVPNKKTVMHTLPVKNPHVFVDATGFEYTVTGKVPEFEKIAPLALRSLYARFWQFPNLNRAAPLMKLLELCEAIESHYAPILDAYAFPDALEFLNDTIIPVTHFIEAKGVHVDKDKFIEHYGNKSKSFIVNDLVYTDYNPYTAAGRVSNRHGGISYAAVNKSDGTREAYTSRHARGAIVLIDWESFHLRLIAEMIGWTTAPKEAFHVYLAKQYFQTDNPTPDEYEQGKLITFQNLYSKNRRQDIPFFRAVGDWEATTWERFTKDTFLNLPGNKALWLDRMEDPSPSKMFNYILQWMETYTAFRLIEELMPLYRTASSSVVLYTYDSLLIDFNMDDGSQLLRDTVRVLEDKGRFPVRVYSGPSYANLKNVTDKVKS